MKYFFRIWIAATIFAGIAEDCGFESTMKSCVLVACIAFISCIIVVTEEK